MSDKELLDKIEAREKLKARGYIWIRCMTCNGMHGLRGYCPACKNKGGYWRAPATR